ncbi:MAG TPA: hypothetical protein ENI51_09455 [Candidatus Atribacteria bacterium]|nr:hypothetical protein [Candidatus Atribacteria bacterium]
MRLGINQILLLNRCKKKGRIDRSDVEVVYGKKTVRRGMLFIDQATPILEKLELYGLIEKQETLNRVFYVLTMKGERILEENLKRIMEVG